MGCKGNNIIEQGTMEFVQYENNWYQWIDGSTDEFFCSKCAFKPLSFDDCNTLTNCLKDDKAGYYQLILDNILNQKIIQKYNGDPNFTQSGSCNCNCQSNIDNVALPIDGIIDTNDGQYTPNTLTPLD